MIISKEEWMEAIQLYNDFKELYITCEQVDPKQQAVWQSLNELRNALDHLMRVMDIQFNGSSSHDAQHEFVRMRGHLRRAFFDICDLLSIHLYNKIINTLEPFAPETIKEAIPNYYTELRPEIEKIQMQISEYRRTKGSSGEPEAVQSYKADVKKLRDIYKNDLLPKMPGMRHIHMKRRLSKWIPYIVGVGGFMIAAVTLLLKLFEQ